MSQQAIEQEVVQLNKILLQTESFDEFQKAHQLVKRNRITTKTKYLHQAFCQKELKSFWFLFNKN
ncbi:MAG: hypothetical protein C4308_11390 [Chitinophagaceae bacterium]